MAESASEEHQRCLAGAFDARQVGLDHRRTAGRLESSDVIHCQRSLMGVGEIVPTGVECAQADRRLDDAELQLAGGRRRLPVVVRPHPRRGDHGNAVGVELGEVAFVRVPFQQQAPILETRHASSPRQEFGATARVVPGTPDDRQVERSPVHIRIIPGDRKRQHPSRREGLDQQPGLRIGFRQLGAGD